MIKGVTAEEEIIIKDILKPYKKSFNFFYYGSRVKGDFSGLSDLDILIKGERAMDLSSLCSIKEMFDISRLPYIVNFSDYNSITSDFYKLIEKDLVEIQII